MRTPNRQLYRSTSVSAAPPSDIHPVDCIRPSSEHAVSISTLHRKQCKTSCGSPSDPMLNLAIAKNEEGHSGRVQSVNTLNRLHKGMGTSIEMGTSYKILSGQPGRHPKRTMCHAALSEPPSFSPLLKQGKDKGMAFKDPSVLRLTRMMEKPITWGKSHTDAIICGILQQKEIGQTRLGKRDV